MVSSCTSGFLDSPKFLSTALHLTSVISTPVHFFGLYCILWKTPENMKSVKWYLVNLHAWVMIFDYCYSLLTIPYILLPYLAGFPLGVLHYIGIPIQIQVLILITFLSYVVNSIIAVFENRFHVVCAYSWKEAWTYWRKWWLVGHYIGSFLLLLSLLVTVPDQKLARDHVTKGLKCLSHDIDDTEIFVFSENILYCTIVFCLYATITITECFLFIGSLISYTLRQFQSRRMSRKTFQIQRKFLLALIIQMEVPLTMLLCPFLYSWWSIFNDYQNQAYVNIAMTIGSLHGFLSTVVMIFVHHPYRRIITNLFLETSLLRSSEVELTPRAVLQS